MTAKLKVTRAEYIRDLFNTKIELQAYRDILGGFWVLAAMPENKRNGTDRDYTHQVNRYDDLANRCSDVLEKLKAIDQSELLP